MSKKSEEPTQPRSNLPPLPRPVQDHLGQKLRAQYHETGDKPKYLGDPMVPVSFDPLIAKIDLTERKRKSEMIGEVGRLAVAAALQPNEVLPPEESRARALDSDWQVAPDRK